MRRLLVTAGSTAVALDKVRVLVNIFRGRTGEKIARVAAEGGWEVTLLSSAREAEQEDHPRVQRLSYRTFEDLELLMSRHIPHGGFDAIIHSAAVSDFQITGVHTVRGVVLEKLELQGSEAAKIPSNHGRLFLELTPAKKLVDQIRDPWGFKGKLVKFKLQADMPDEELLKVAARSLIQSKADLVVANCLEWSREYAYIVDGYSAEKVTRQDLAQQLLGRL